jgi:uncharacterized membrane protein YczE
MFLKHGEKFGTREWVRLIILGLIICIGVYVIILSLYMIAGNTPSVPGAFMPAIVMISVACVMIGFAVSIYQIESKEEKLAMLAGRLDNILGKIGER